MPPYLLRLQRPLAAVFIIAGVLFAAYSNSFRGPFIFDDGGSTLENESIKSLATGLFPPGNSGNTVSGRPVLNFTLAVNYAIHGYSVSGYHVANLLIHTLGALALFGLVRRTLLLPGMRERFGEWSWWTALAAAGLWALHPLQTESVTYIIQRAESLVGLFYLATLYFFVRSVEQPEHRVWKLAAVVSCLLGMGSKEVMAGAPVVILFYDRAFIAGSFRQAWRERKGLYVAFALTWVLLAVCILWTGKRGATVGYNAYATMWRYALTQSFAIVHYLKKVVWPNPLVLDYGQTLAYNFADASKQLYIVLVLAGASLWAAIKRPRIGFCCVFFFAVLAPSSSVVPVLTQTLAEHRMYLAIAPLAGLLVVGAHALVGPRMLFMWAVVAIALGTRTYIRNGDYRTEEGIWQAVTRDCPYNPRGWNALSAVRAKAGDLAGAKKALRQALAYCPKDADIMATYGDVLARLKETQEAEDVYRYALTFVPDHHEALRGLGVLMLDQKRTAEAIEYLEKSLASKPDGRDALYHLGKALVEAGRIDEGVARFEQVLQSDPAASGARNNLANALITQGRAAQALPLLQEGIQLDPKEVELLRTLGLAYLQLGRAQEAVQPLEQAIRVSPGDAKAHANLGLAMASLGRRAEAREQYERALEGADLSIDMKRALNISLADMWQEDGNLPRAKSHYEQAVAAAPGDPNVAYLLANLCLRMGDAKSAIPIYEQVAAAAPGLTDAQYELGLAYEKQGNRTLALRQFRKVLAQQPGHAGAREATDRVK